jgi:hypothetical protein
MRTFVSGEAARLYCETTRRLFEAVNAGVMTAEDYQQRLRAIDEWLNERRLYVLPDPASGYVLIRNPVA